jgi:hypothetical protein
MSKNQQMRAALNLFRFQNLCVASAGSIHLGWHRLPFPLHLGLADCCAAGALLDSDDCATWQSVAAVMPSAWSSDSRSEKDGCEISQSYRCGLLNNCPCGIGKCLAEVQVHCTVHHLQVLKTCQDMPILLVSLGKRQGLEECHLFS